MSENKTIREEKIKKANKLKELGFNPYPNSFEIDCELNYVHDKYNDKLKAHEETQDEFQVAGRIVLHRDMGGLQFITIQDENSRLQLAFIKKVLGEDFNLLKYYDLGDIIGIQGTVFKTKKGELSIKVKNFTMLCKSLTDLGDKFHGLKDVELKYRNRSLDMVMNENSLPTI